MSVRDDQQVQAATPTLPRQVLVAIDQSPVAREACRQAILLARIAEAELTILHVASPAAPRNAMGRIELRQVAAAAEAEGHRLLASAGQVAAGQVPYRLEMGSGDPAAAICRRARELGADLIVTGNRGLDGLDRFFLGSVSASVAQRAHCSVLVVRQSGDQGA